jgi:hypothetical protein
MPKLKNPSAQSKPANFSRNRNTKARGSVRIMIFPYAIASEAFVGSATEFVLNTRNVGSAANTNTSPD